MKSIIITLIFYLLLPANAFAQTCRSNIPTTTSPERFLVEDNGTVVDKETDLVWKRCTEGQLFDPETKSCLGNYRSYNWPEGLAAAETSSFAEKFDWRLPNIKELDSLVDRHCISPAIELVSFPQTPSVLFLSGTPYARSTDPKLMLYVDFNNGSLNHGPRNDQIYAVRLVRHLLAGDADGR